jgi:hypothetical protein
VSSLAVRAAVRGAEVAAAAETILARLADLQLDAPAAPAVVARFLAYLVQDDVLPEGTCCAVFEAGGVVSIRCYPCPRSCAAWRAAPAAPAAPAAAESLARSQQDAMGFGGSASCDPACRHSVHRASRPRAAPTTQMTATNRTHDSHPRPLQRF